MSKRAERIKQREQEAALMRCAVPEALTKLNNWLLWRYQLDSATGKRKKRPKMTNNKAASPTDPATWTSFDNAVEAYINGTFDGIGFDFGNSPYMGIDIDDCINGSGDVSELAQDIVQTLEHGYVEVSPSGRGLHIVLKASKPAGNCRLKVDGQGLEMYDAGRFFTFTGRIYEDKYGYSYSTINTDVEEVQDAVYTVFGKYWRAVKTSTVDQSQGQGQGAEQVESVGSGLSDEAIIKRILELRAGKRTKEGDSERILNLWLGNWEKAGYPSPSEADLALMDCLAFWTGKSKKQMARLFNSSGLFRPKKWGQTTDSANGLTYGAQMIEKACASTKAVYSPIRRRHVHFPKIDEEGAPIAGHVENVKAMLDYLGIELRFNDISHKVDVFRGSDRDGFNYESTLAEVKSLCHEHGLKISKDDLYTGCRYWADKNSYNPFFAYLYSCYTQFKDDDSCGEAFDELCEALPLTSGVDSEFCYHLLHLWLRQVVYIAENDGSRKPQSMLVLRGPQGIGKSSLVAKLLPRELVLTEQGLDMSNKDIIMTCTSTGICELSELGGTLKEANSYKRFITAESDTYRAPYDRIAQTYPRRTSYIGTVNDSTFLIDKTGDRRYFVLPLKSIDWNRLNKIDIQKLWAFIVSECEEKATYCLTREEARQIMVINRRYSKLTDVEQQIIDLLCWEEREDLWRLVSPSELCEELTGNVGRANVFGRRLAEMADRGEIDPPVEQHGTGVKKYKLPCKRLLEYARDN